MGKAETFQIRGILTESKEREVGEDGSEKGC